MMRAVRASRWAEQARPCAVRPPARPPCQPRGGGRERAARGRRCLRDLNKLMMPRLMPDAPPRLDYEAAPYYNRTADEVGNYYFLHRRGGSLEYPVVVLKPCRIHLTGPDTASTRAGPVAPWRPQSVLLRCRLEPPTLGCVDLQSAHPRTGTCTVSLCSGG